MARAKPQHATAGSSAQSRAPDWAVERLGVRRLWKRGLRGQGILIGHLDTGIDATHPLLRTRLAEFRSFDRHGQPDGSVASHDSGTHGTRTASLICGSENGGVPIGVAPEARLLSGQVIENGDALARVLSGLDWLASRRVRVCCLAMGFEHSEPIFSIVLRRLHRHGMLVVAPVGNGGAGRVLSPASEPRALSVGAGGEAGRIVSFSGSSMSGFACVAPCLIAPGAKILAAAAQPGDVVTCSGTSYAAAYVAGVAALLLQARPETSPTGLMQALAATARPAAEEQSHRCASGFVEPLAALDFLVSEPAMPIEPATNDRESSSAALDPQLARLVESRSDDEKTRALLCFREDHDNTADDFRIEAAQFIAEVSRATSQTPARNTILPWLRLLLVNAPRRWLRHALTQPAVARADYCPY